MHPLIRMQRDAMLHAKKIQAGNEPAINNSIIAPELVSASTSPAWSPEPSTPYLASHPSGSASPYSPAAPLGALPPDALQLGALPLTYNTPAHVPSNASYDVYVRQRHESPQPLLEIPYEDQRSGHMNDRSFLGGTSAECLVPSNAVTEWPPYMYNPHSQFMPQWQAIPATKPMSTMSSSSTTGFSRDSSSPSSFGGFESSTPLSLHDLIVTPSTFESNEDPIMQLISDSSYLSPDLIPPPHNHCNGNNYQEDATQLTNYSFQSYMNYQPPTSMVL